MRKSTEIEICNIKWKNPVTTAAGTFVYEHSQKYYDVSELGAVTTKGVAPVAWSGNKTPRIAETYGGMLNAVGLENPGVDAFIHGELKKLKDAGITVIVNVVGHTADDYADVVKKLDTTDADMLEINVSCPNISAGGLTFGTDLKAVYDLIEKIRPLTVKPIIVKLTPNVTDIAEIAAAAESAGADAISLINTLIGMRIDINTGEPILANGTGGLSGPAIKPVAVAMVYKVANRVKIPIIGMGGIMTGEDAMEFLLAGATAVAVGTAALVDPVAPVRVAQEMATLMEGNDGRHKL